MKYSIKYKKLKVMNQIYHIYRKEDPMKRIVLLLAVGLMISVSEVFAQLPALQKGDPLTFMVENHFRDREYQERIYWERAKKIGLYDVELSYDFVGTYETGRPADMEPGNEYWLPAFTAMVTNVADRNTCELCFDIGACSAILKGYPTEGLRVGKIVVLTSPVICTAISSSTGLMFLKFVSKEELAERIAEGEDFDENQLKAIRKAGYEKWDYRDGGHFWAKYESVSKGKLHLIDMEGKAMTVKPAELTPESSAVYRREWKKAVTKERRERAEKQKNSKPGQSKTRKRPQR